MAKIHQHARLHDNQKQEYNRYDVPSADSDSGQITEPAFETSKTPDVAIDERGLVRNVHLFVCVHNAVKYYIVY